MDEAIAYGFSAFVERTKMRCASVDGIRHLRLSKLRMKRGGVVASSKEIFVFTHI